MHLVVLTPQGTALLTLCVPSAAFVLPSESCGGDPPEDTIRDTVVAQQTLRASSSVIVNMSTGTSEPGHSSCELGSSSDRHGLERPLRQWAGVMTLPALMHTGSLSAGHSLLEVAEFKPSVAVASVCQAPLALATDIAGEPEDRHHQTPSASSSALAPGNEPCVREGLAPTYSHTMHTTLSSHWDDPDWQMPSDDDQ